MSISAQREESSELRRRESETEMLTGKRGKREKKTTESIKGKIMHAKI